MYTRKLSSAFLGASFTSLLLINSSVWQRAFAQVFPESPPTDVPSPAVSPEPSPSPSVTASPSSASPQPSVPTSPSPTVASPQPSLSPTVATPRPSRSPRVATPRPSLSPRVATPRPSPTITQQPTASPQASPQTSPTTFAPQPLEESPTPVPSPAVSPEPTPSPSDNQKKSGSLSTPLWWITGVAIVLLLAGISQFLLRKRSIQPRSAAPPVKPDVDFTPVPDTTNQSIGSKEPHLDIALEMHPDPGSQTLGFQNAIPGIGNQSDSLKGSLRMDLNIALAMYPDAGSQTLKSPQGLVDGVAHRASS